MKKINILLWRGDDLSNNQCLCGHEKFKKFWEKKNCQTEVVNFQNCFEKFQNSLAIFEQSSHFCTWKMQNLESRHQN